MMADANATAVRRRHKPPGSSPSEPIYKYTSNEEPQRREKIAESAPFELRPAVAFLILLASHTLAALYHPIQDCDEVFNYWEPTHYLTHGHAFQTWEYSPVYAIRSWAYAGLHALLTLPSKALPFGNENDKSHEFYATRILLGLVSALCSTRLFTTISAVLNPRIAIIWLVIMATSPGMFHASISYLPSSFTMYTTMLGMAAFMDWRGGLRTAQGILAIGAGACLGWPFAAAMAIPSLLEEVLFAAISDRQAQKALFWRVSYGTLATLLVLALQVAIDSVLYRKSVIVPLNIVYYNIFSNSGGPDLYGTEPWHFYLRNLALNFHLWLPLAIISLPLLVRQHVTQSKAATKVSALRGLTFLTPFYLWLAIFTLQPHKEERFMYPAYPALAFNAAVAFHVLLSNISSTNPQDMVSRIPLQLRFLAILGFVFAALALSAIRTLGTITAFGAPLSIYQPLQQPGVARAEDTVCLGKEWYRFPSHYFFPSGVEAKFIKSEFAGLLPGSFYPVQNQSIFSLRTHIIPPGMNDQNIEDPGKYTDISHCDFLVDSSLSSTQTTELEPNYTADTKHWERVKCLPFLDAASTGVVGRLGYVPDLPFVPRRWTRVFGEYCLLRRKKEAERVEERRFDVPRIETLG